MKSSGLYVRVGVGIFCIVVLSTLSYGQEGVQDNTGAAFLTIDPFPRSAAMGSAFTGISGEVGCLHFNPGGLALTEGDIITSTHCEWFQSMRFEDVALAHGMGKGGALGVNVKGFYVTGLEKRTQDTPDPEGTFGAYFVDFGATYARKLFYFMPVGLSVKGIYEKIEESSATGFCLDLGMQYLTAIDGLQFGVSLKNIGSKMMFKDDEFPLPGSIRGGIMYRFLGGNCLLSADLEKMGKRDATVNVGSEVLIMKTLSLRVGYNGEVGKDMDSKTAGIAAGAGFAVGDLSVDYAFVNYDYLGMTHRFGLTFTPGVTAAERKRIEELARLEAQKAIQEKERMMSSLYLERGKECLSEGDFDDAISNLDIALVWDPMSEEAKEFLKRAQEEKVKEEEKEAFSLGKEAFESGNYLEAVAQLDRVIELNPKNKEAFDIRSHAKVKLEEEVRILAEKEKEKSEEIQSLLSSAVKEYSRGNYRTAISKWQKVLTLDPDQDEARDYIEKSRGKISEVVTQLEADLEKKKKKKDWLGVLSISREIRSLEPTNEKANSAEKRANSEIQSLIQANLKKAKEFYSSGNLFSSEEYFRIVLRYDPGNKEAKSYIKKIEKGGKQEDADNWYLKGIDAYTKNQFKLAISYWNRCLSIDPNYEKASKNIERAQKKLVELGELK
jgi:tetratricopeptide (TPR) repeat protein